jgi:hypothetical protein
MNQIKLNEILPILSKKNQDNYPIFISNWKLLEEHKNWFQNLPEEVLKELEIQVESSESESRFSLKLNSENWSPLCIDLMKMIHNYQLKLKKGEKFLQLQALPKKLTENTLVIDTTAGFLQDTGLFLAKGVQVCAFERNPLISLLIKENRLDEMTGFKFFPHQFDLKCLEELNQTPEDKVFYVDPMFNFSLKRVSNKYMEFLRLFENCWPIDDWNFLLKHKKISDRIIVKRGLKEVELLGKPHYSLKGKTIRLDIY